MERKKNKICNRTLSSMTWSDPIWSTIGWKMHFVRWVINFSNQLKHTYCFDNGHKCRWVLERNGYWKREKHHSTLMRDESYLMKIEWTTWNVTDWIAICAFCTQNNFRSNLFNNFPFQSNCSGAHPLAPGLHMKTDNQIGTKREPIYFDWIDFGA